MKLEQFFAGIAPFLEGRESHAQVVSALYGDAATRDDQASRDAARLEIYGRFCRGHRFGALGSTFEETRASVLRLLGEPAWEALVTDYFRAHPMHHAELNENGSELPAFLLLEASARGLPAWICELADLEWWSFRTRVAPDALEDQAPDKGPLRLGATVELRPYAHDLCGWLEEPRDAAARTGAPEARPCVALFWRDRDLDSRVGEAEPLELAILQAIHLQRPLAEVTAHAGQDAGVLLGSRDASG